MRNVNNKHRRGPSKRRAPERREAFDDARIPAREEAGSPLRTPDEAARYLRATRMTLAIWRCRPGRGPKLPFIKRGRRVFYLQTDLDAALQRWRAAS